MADNKLTIADQSAGLEPEIPQVQTLARPVAASLLAARHEAQRNPVLQKLVCQARKEKWSATQLAEAITPELTARLEDTPEQIAQVAQYLADEYSQIGDALLIVSNVTGKAIARITDKDICLMQLTETELDNVRPFAEVRAGILAKLQEPKAQNAVETYIQSLRIRANVRYMVPRDSILKG